MTNNFNISLEIWESIYATDYALLDTPQEQIEFLKDLLIKNKENIIETEKFPQHEPSIVQLTNQINDEFAPRKPTEKEWKKRWNEVIEDLAPVYSNQRELAILKDEQELLISKLEKVRQENEHQLLSSVENIHSISSAENTHSRKPHIFFIGHQKANGIPKGKAWINFKSLATESKGEKEIEIQEFGKIYLKRDSSDLENTVLWFPIKFESSKDGIPISKTAFDKAYDRHNTDN
ncbi:MAG: hypothetical protein P8L36_07945 [SAR324 cluster bacterium]|nr:hypothetical protein [SAR324 cluster bacterium]